MVAAAGSKNLTPPHVNKPSEFAMAAIAGSKDLTPPRVSKPKPKPSSK